MATDSLCSPVSPIPQDELGSGVWMGTDTHSAEDGGQDSTVREDSRVVACADTQDEGSGRGSPLTVESVALDCGVDRCLPSAPPCSGTTSPAECSTGSVNVLLPDQLIESISVLGSLQIGEEGEECRPTPLLSKESGQHNVDCNSMNFTAARDQWVRRDSTSSKAPIPACSMLSSWSQMTEASYSLNTELQGEALIHLGSKTKDIHQGELLSQNLAPLDNEQEVQQVCQGAPPLTTVAGEQANPERDSPISGSIVMNKPVTEPGRKREGRESEQIEREREEKAVDPHSGRAGNEKQQGKKDLKRVNNKGAQQKSKVQPNSQAPLQNQRGSRMEVDLFDDNQSDSGVSADFSPGSTVDFSSSSLGSDLMGAQDPPANETPIEREIRVAIRREKSLRRSRGLDKTQEYVEIPIRRSILNQGLPSKSGKTQSKDRYLAGRKMQREIHAETERERELVKLGRLPGFYDKGTIRELRERKLLFEAFQEPKEPPLHIRRSASSSINSIATSGMQENNFTTSSSQPGSSLEHQPSLDLLTGNPPSTPPTTHGRASGSAPRGPSLIEGHVGQVIILDSSSILQAPFQGTSNRPLTPLNTVSLKDGVTVVDSVSMRSRSVEPRGDYGHNLGIEEDKEVSAMVRDNPFFKLRPSMSLRPKVEQDIQETRERELDLRRQRNSLYGAALASGEGEGNGGGGGGGGGRRSPSKEIHSPTPPQSALSSQDRRSRFSTSSASVRQSLGKLDLSWPPSHADDVQTGESGAHESPKKTPLVQRWESGKVNGQEEEQS